MNRVDPTGMASTYNWSTSRYEDESGNEVSWQEVMAEYKIGIDEESVDEDPPSKGNVDGSKVNGYKKVYFPSVGTLKKEEGNVIAPALPWWAATGKYVGTAASSVWAIFIAIPILFQSDVDNSTPYVKKAEDSNKNEKHVDSGIASVKGYKGFVRMD